MWWCMGGEYTTPPHGFKSKNYMKPSAEHVFAFYVLTPFIHLLLCYCHNLPPKSNMQVLQKVMYAS